LERPKGTVTYTILAIRYESAPESS
jgi:hypothetical protein